MPASASIYYLQHHEIDKSLWDACIDRSENGLIYAKSYYLDTMCDHWDALVYNNYEAVMPLVWRRKYGIHYLYQPYFTAALGVFGTAISPLLTGFVNAIPPKFMYWDIDMNEANFFANDLMPPVSISPRVNFILPLCNPYERLYAAYSRRAKRTLMQAQANSLTIVKQVAPEEVIFPYMQHYKHQHSIPRTAYQNLVAAAHKASAMGGLKTYIAQTEGKTTIAFLLCLADEKFVYAVLGGSTPEGKQKGAFTLLINSAISEHSGSGKVLRFEGSDNPAIAFFNAQFGAQKIHYPHLKQNRLPWPLRYLKN